jgi:hypothetical protein
MQLVERRHRLVVSALAAERAARTGETHHMIYKTGPSGRTGIWHETYLVRAGEYEAVYGNMPPFGLGKAGRLMPVSESSTARGRLKAAGGTTDSAV